MMLNCHRATRLMSEELDRPLSRTERMALWLHNAMCAGCSNYRRHMGFLRRISTQWRSGQPASED